MNASIIKAILVSLVLTGLKLAMVVRVQQTFIGLVDLHIRVQRGISGPVSDGWAETGGLAAIGARMAARARRGGAALARFIIAGAVLGRLCFRVALLTRRRRGCRSSVAARIARCFGRELALRDRSTESKRRPGGFA